MPGDRTIPMGDGPRDRFHRVDELFREAARLAPVERAAFLDRQCAGDESLRDEVLALLGEDEAPAGPLDRPALGHRVAAVVDAARAAAAAGPVPAAMPDRIGRYRVIRCVGQGGMGVVYEAEQESPRRKVALKVINAGVVHVPTLRRFEQEAQVLGKLQHPGIAQVFEAGTFDTSAGTQPYFAMEFIDGESVTDYVNQRECSTRQRLELIASICDAVEHAHQRGVIHRDLKPTNILVDRLGHAKILDFGVARATDADIRTTTMQTDIGQLIGTVPYMSPEQAIGDPGALDSRSDVYALGVVAYELLTGRLPYEIHHKMLHEAVRIIREDDPTPLSSINRYFSGDIETIVGRALEKDKARRYQSAAALSADIRRYLHDQPITARPPSQWYKLSKFAKRNKAVVVGTLTVLAVLVAALAVSITLLLRTRNAEQRATADARTAEQVADALAGLFSLTSLFGVEDPSEAGAAPITAREILDNGAARVLVELEGEPAVLAPLLDTIGNAYVSIGVYDRPIPLLEEALALRRDLHAGPHEDVAESLHHLGLALHWNHEYERALGVLREAMEMRRVLLADDLAVADTLGALGRVLAAMGDYESAERHDREALALRRRIAPDDEDGLAEVEMSLAEVLTERGSFDEAEALFRQALQRLRRVYGNHHAAVATALHNLGSMLRDRDDFAAAEPLLIEALALNRELRGGDHPMVAKSLNSLARLRRATGRADEAVRLHRAALDIQRRVLPAGHTSTATTLSNLARAVDAAGGTPEEVGALYREALQVFEASGDPGNPNVPTIMHNLALTARARGDLEEASALFREAAERNRVIRGSADPRVLSDLGAFADVEMRLGRPEAAEPALRELVEARRQAHGDRGPRTAEARSRLGACLAARGRFEEAEQMLVESYELLFAELGADDEVTSEAVRRIIDCYERWGREDAARTWRAVRDAAGAS